MGRFSSSARPTAQLLLLLLPVCHSFAGKHYAEHEGKPFYPKLVDFLSSGAVVGMVWEGKDVVKTGRAMVGGVGVLVGVGGPAVWGRQCHCRARCGSQPNSPQCCYCGAWSPFPPAPPHTHPPAPPRSVMCLLARPLTLQIGATNPLASAAGTIRGDLALDVGRNVIHGSDSVESAQREIALWFRPEELADYDVVAASWIYE